MILLGRRTLAYIVATALALAAGLAASAPPASAAAGDQLFWVGTKGAVSDGLYGATAGTVASAAQLNSLSGLYRSLATDGTYLYFSDGTNLVRTALDGTGKTTVVAGVSAPGGIAISGSNLYYTLYSGGVYGVSLASLPASPSQIFTAAGSGWNGLAISGSSIYAIYNSGSGTQGNQGLYSATLNGLSSVTATMIDASAAMTYRAGNIAVTEGKLYASGSNGSIPVRDMTAGTWSSINVSGATSAGIYSIAIVGTTMYFSTTGGVIGSVQTDGTGAAALTAGGQFSGAWSIAAKSPPSYTLTYDANSATSGTVPTDASSPYVSGSTVTVLGNTGSLARTGYAFAGWNTAAAGSGTSYAAGATFAINANTTLYAQWKHSVTYDANAATSGTVPTDVSSPYANGATVTVLGNTGSLARTGYTFAGWNTAAAGSGTSYAAGATFTISTNTTLYAQWTASGGGGGGSSGGGSSGSSTPAPTPSASTSPVVLPALDPQGATSGLTPGQDAVTVGGQPVPVVIRPNTANTGLDVDGPGWGIALQPQESGGSAAPLGPDGVLRLVQGERLAAQGSGFKPGTPVRIYLFSDPLLLGVLTTDASGAFAGEVDVPAGIEVGAHTAQVNGYTMDDQVRSVSLGVEVVEPKARTTSVGTRVYFGFESARLTPKAKATLRTLVAQVPEGGTSATVVVGIVQAQSPTPRDWRLAKARARNVARYLTKAGLPGTVTVRARRVPVANIPDARRVSVLVRITRGPGTTEVARALPTRMLLLD